MTPDEIKRLYEAEAPILSAWGEFVRDAIQAKFASVLKMPVTWRLKTTDSLIEKALHRRKPYTDPYRDITDKVGVRAVVLLERHVGEITGWAQAQPAWENSLDRDFESERRNEPTIFNYQSNHLILRSRVPQRVGDVDVPVGTACELQIRTLLQHAYSELSHDLIYKTKLLVQPDVKRLAARSMALIETTDGVFLKVHDSIRDQEAPALAVSSVGADALRDLGVTTWNDRVNQVLLDALRELLASIDLADLRSFLAEKKRLLGRLLEWQQQHPVYVTPAVLAALYLIPKRPNDLVAAWPYTREEEEKLFTLMGQRLPSE